MAIRQPRPVTYSRTAGSRLPSGFVVLAANFMARQLSLRLTDPIQQLYRIQRCEDLSQLIFALLGHPFTGQKTLVRRRRGMIQFRDFRRVKAGLTFWWQSSLLVLRCKGRGSSFASHWASCNFATFINDAR